MDALTSFEVDAQRRRETVANDRDLAWARADRFRASSVEPATGASPVFALAAPVRVATESDCQPAPLARQSVG
jgi:hypothetical protein